MAYSNVIVAELSIQSDYAEIHWYSIQTLISISFGKQALQDQHEIIH